MQFLIIYLRTTALHTQSPHLHASKSLQLIESCCDISQEIPLIPESPCLKASIVCALVSFFLPPGEGSLPQKETWSSFFLGTIGLVAPKLSQVFKLWSLIGWRMKGGDFSERCMWHWHWTVVLKGVLIVWFQVWLSYSLSFLTDIRLWGYLILNSTFKLWPKIIPIFPKKLLFSILVKETKKWTWC